jgi:hypothetical protein
VRRLVATSLSTLLLLALLAPTALAREGHDAGQGTYGEADDKVVTKAGFIIIIFFPLVILLLSMLQAALDRRKTRRKKSLSAQHWAGGW